MGNRDRSGDCFVCDMIGYAVFALLLGFAFYPTETAETFADMKVAFDERVEAIQAKE